MAERSGKFLVWIWRSLGDIHIFQVQLHRAFAFCLLLQALASIISVSLQLWSVVLFREVFLLCLGKGLTGVSSG